MLLVRPVCFDFLAGEFDGADMDVGMRYRLPLTSFVFPVGVAYVTELADGAPLADV